MDGRGRKPGDREAEEAGPGADCVDDSRGGSDLKETPCMYSKPGQMLSRWKLGRAKRRHESARS